MAKVFSTHLSISITVFSRCAEVAKVFPTHLSMTVFSRCAEVVKVFSTHLSMTVFSRCEGGEGVQDSPVYNSLQQE